VHGEEQRLGVAGRIGRTAGPSIPSGIACQPLQLLHVASVAEDHVVSGPSEDRSELAAHQT
jgi:hypothetical protein